METESIGKFRFKGWPRMLRRGMDKFLLRIFQHEVERQCTFALIAFDDLVGALKRHDMDRLWYSAQAFLVAAGNISKLLWPSQPRLAKRGGQLRTSLSISDGSMLAPRNFRNHFEHFDERLEEWAISSHRRNFVDSNVGPPGMIAGVDTKDFLRNFDTKRFAITFRGDTYALRPVVKAVQQLRDTAVKVTPVASREWRGRYPRR